MIDPRAVGSEQNYDLLQRQRNVGGAVAMLRAVGKR